MKFDLFSDINKAYAASMNYEKVDAFIVRVHWWSFGWLAFHAFVVSIIKIADSYLSPLSWRVIPLPDALIALLIALASVLLVHYYRGKIANHYHWRLMVATTLNILTYLLIFLSGGAIELHFLFFTMMALIVVYSDWRLGWFMLLLIAIHHSTLNYFAPEWVYEYGRNDLALLVHAIPVVITAIFTTMLCENTRNAIKTLEDAKTGLADTVRERTQELEKAKQGLEEKVAERTKELEATKSDLEKTVADLRETNNYLLEKEMKYAKLEKDWR